VIRLLIADDEAPARTKLRKLLATDATVEIIGEAKDGVEAVDLIRTLEPDLVLLDIQMPRLDGFGVIETIGVEQMPPVVFVTAYDEYAVRAFEVHAFAYLLKPFAASRLRKVLDRAKSRLEKESTPSVVARVQELLETVSGRSPFLTRIRVEKEDEREVLLSVERIDLIRADRNYLRFFTDDGEFVRRGTLTELLERLDPEKFMRINRSEVVRLDAVKELNPWFHGDYRVQLHRGKTLTWSRRYRAKQKNDF